MVHGGDWLLACAWNRNLKQNAGCGLWTVRSVAQPMFDACGWVGFAQRVLSSVLRDARPSVSTVVVDPCALMGPFPWSGSGTPLSAPTRPPAARARPPRVNLNAQPMHDANSDSLFKRERVRNICHLARIITRRVEIHTTVSRVACSVFVRDRVQTTITCKL